MQSCFQQKPPSAPLCQSTDAFPAQPFHWPRLAARTLLLPRTGWCWALPTPQHPGSITAPLRAWRLRRGHGKSAARQEREREKYKLLKGGPHSRFNARALECNGKIPLASEKKSDKIHYNLSAWSPFASALVQVDLAQKGELATFLRGVEGFHARTWGIKNLETKKGSPQFSDIPVISRLLEFSFPLYPDQVVSPAFEISFS